MPENGYPDNVAHQLRECHGWQLKKPRYGQSGNDPTQWNVKEQIRLNLKL